MILKKKVISGQLNPNFFSGFIISLDFHFATENYVFRFKVVLFRACYLSLLLKLLSENPDRSIPFKGLSIKIMEKLIFGLNIVSLRDFYFKPIQVAL